MLKAWIASDLLKVLAILSDIILERSIGERKDVHTGNWKKYHIPWHDQQAYYLEAFRRFLWKEKEDWWDSSF